MRLVTRCNQSAIMRLVTRCKQQEGHRARKMGHQNVRTEWIFFSWIV